MNEYDDNYPSDSSSCDHANKNISLNNTSHSNNTLKYTQNQQQTRHARRLYFGGIPPQYADEELFKMFLNDVISRCLEEENDSSYVVSLYINVPKCFAFVEFKSIELTTACLELDGLIYRNNVLRVQRANEYKPELVQLIPRTPLKLNLTHLPKINSSSKISTENFSVSEDKNLGSYIQTTSIDKITNGSIVLLGFPYDEGTKRSDITTGCSAASKVARRYIKKIKAIKNIEFNIDLSLLSIQDVGDIPPYLSYEESHQLLSVAITFILQKGGIPFILGGSESQIYNTSAGLMNVAGGNIGLININSSIRTETNVILKKFYLVF